LGFSAPSGLPILGSSGFPFLYIDNNMTGQSELVSWFGSMQIASEKNATFFGDVWRVTNQKYASSQGFERPNCQL